MIKERNYSIDTFRIIAIFVIILYHTEVFRYQSDIISRGLYRLFDSIRFPIPFFFMTSGYFFGKSLSQSVMVDQALLKYCRRILPLFLFWSIIYAFIEPRWIANMYNEGFMENAFQKFISRLQFPISLLMTGTQDHLWFLPALLIGIFILAVLVWLKQEKYLILIGGMLYVITLLSKTYSMTAFGIKYDHEMRHGPMVSTLFIGLGWLFSQKNNYRLSVAIWLMIIGLLMQVFENIYLKVFYGMGFGHEYLLGTIPFGMGLFSFLLTYPNIGKNTPFPNWGRLTLGIYLTHMLVIHTFSWLNKYFGSLEWNLLFPFAVCAISIGFTSLLKQNTYTKRLVAYAN